MADTSLQTTAQTIEDTDIYSKEMLTELSKREKAVRTAMSGIDKNMEKIVFNLYWIYSNKAYRAMGCESITDYAQKTFDFQKTTTYNFICIAERFAARNADGSIAESFDRKYKGYSPSKLSVLYILNDDQIKDSGITPEMSVRDIKRTVKEIQEESDGYARDSAEQDRSGQKGTAENTESDGQGIMTIHGSELSAPDSGPNDNDTDDDGYDDEGISGYAADTVYEFSLQDSERDIVREIKAVLKETKQEHEEASFSLILRYPVRRQG